MTNTSLFSQFRSTSLERVRFASVALPLVPKPAKVDPVPLFALQSVRSRVGHIWTIASIWSLVSGAATTEIETSSGPKAASHRRQPRHKRRHFRRLPNAPHGNLRDHIVHCL